MSRGSRSHYERGSAVSVLRALGYRILRIDSDDGTPYAISLTAAAVIEVDGNAGAAPGPMTLTLPTLASSYVGSVGQRLWVVAPTAATQAITIDGNGAETINGAANYVMATSNQVVCLEAHSGDWKVIHDSTVVAGAGMTGGGIGGSTLNIVANADGSMVVNADDIQVGVLATDVQHGARGGGTQHAVATGAVAGFHSAADKTAHDANVTALTERSCKATDATEAIVTATMTPFPFVTESWDVGGFHDNITNPSRFTVPAGGAGQHMLTAGGIWTANATGTRLLRLVKNDATVLREVAHATGAGGIADSMDIGILDDLAVGDYVELHVYQSSGGNLNILNVSFEITKQAHT